MKIIRFYPKLLRFLVRHFFLNGVMTVIQYGIDTQSATRLGRTDEIYNHLIAC